MEPNTGVVMELDSALDSTLAVLRTVQPGDLDKPTPCASWDVRALINHFIGTARWWAAVVRADGDGGAGADDADAGADDDSGADDAEEDFAAGDFVAAYTESIRLARRAFRAPGALARTVKVPFGEFPGAVLQGFAATDQFAHGWDLARALGRDTDLDPDLAVALLDLARVGIGEPLRGPDGQAPFGPARQAPAGAGAADRLAAFLGRAV